MAVRATPAGEMTPILTPLKLRAALLDLCEDQICWLESAEDARQVAAAAQSTAPAVGFDILAPVPGSTLWTVCEIPAGRTGS